MAIKAALTTSASTKAMVQAAIVLPDRGLPAIMASIKMLLSSTAAPGFLVKNYYLEAKTCGTPSRDEVPGLQIASLHRNAGIH
jgi:hypothetical protein